MRSTLLSTQKLLKEAEEENSQLILEQIALLQENSELLSEMNDLVDQDFFKGLTDEIMAICCPDSATVGILNDLQINFCSKNYFSFLAHLQLEHKTKRIKLEAVDRKSNWYDFKNLLDTAAIIMTGIEFEKYEAFMILTNRKDSMVTSSTFYRYLPRVEKTLEEVFLRSVFEIVQYLFKNKKQLPEIAASIDGAWNQRQGMNSALGNFALVLVTDDDFLNGKVLFEKTKTKERTRLNSQGEEKVVHVGNHKGIKITNHVIILIFRFC